MTDKIAATPGPWEWSGLQLLGDCNDDSCSPVLIAQGDPFDPSEADKALIAAAPDLLAALNAMVEKYDFDMLPPDHPIVHARAAIAKAEAR